MRDSSGNWFSKVFKKNSQPFPKRDSGVALKPNPKQDLEPDEGYKKGDFIGQRYEVLGILGKGGFGVVYKVHSNEMNGIYALKTFQDIFIPDQEVRKRFHKEARIWVEMGSYPYLVRADVVDEVSGRLFIVMEYITPNNEGWNSLKAYLQHEPPDLAQSLRWAIQVCHGMEYAYSKGMRAHRDLKPDNIMIDQKKTARITDFGLAGAISESPEIHSTGLAPLPGQTFFGAGFGTPTHMAPEQFENAAGCDQRSDIYSFGVVLFQLASRGDLPFPAADWQVMQRLHRESHVPHLDSPLFPIIQRCLEKQPEKRYPTFKEVRKDLDLLLQQNTGEVIVPLQLKDGVAEWNNKGVGLHNLGRYEEAIRCLDRALEINPNCVPAWDNKGNSLNYLGRHAEALHCLDKALKIDPTFANAWNDKGNSLNGLNQPQGALHSYDIALKFDPRLLTAWFNKGGTLFILGRFGEAIGCYDKALDLDKRYIAAWNNKGNCLKSLGRYQEAISCYDKALELDPTLYAAWINKGLEEDGHGQREEAIHSYEQFLVYAPAQYELQITYARKRLRELDGR